jgi:K+-transporting ATPase A subunit
LEDDILVAIVVLSTMFCAVGLVLYAARGRQRLRELAMRERIALIEKGLVPPPEMDPGRFEAQTRLIVAAQALAQRPGGSKAARYRSAGVIVMGLGCALLMLLTFAGGVPDVGLGLGGGFAILGLAIFVNGMLVGHDPAPHIMPPPHQPLPPEPPDVGP